MMEVQQATHGGGPAGARAEFVSSIGRRLAILRTALRELEARPTSPGHRDVVLRRLHALGAASRVLGFDAVAEELTTAESALHRAAATGETTTRDLAEVARALERVPPLVWGAPSNETATATEGFPVMVVAFGDDALGRALEKAEGPAILEYDLADSPEQALEQAQSLGPDVIIVDGDREDASELIDTLMLDPSIDPFALIVIGDFPNPEAAAVHVARGAARVLPKPVSPDMLSRNINEVARRASEANTAREPIGDVTVEELASRVAAEVRRGLVDSIDPTSARATVPFGEGIDVMAAVWSSVARLREIATLRSGGSVRFHAGGPEGAIPLAPWPTDRRGGERQRGARGADNVRLEGRLAVVADDDPAVVWFLSGLLKTAGVEVIEAHDGQKALEKCFGRWPDLLISDVLMPKMDGFALCREIKRDVALRDVPVVLLSWKEDLLQRLRELGAEADGYLKKEAAGGIVLERFKEVLRPRARVEARLAAGGVVRGRLDGLTPRLILELACARHRDCRVSFRDSVYLYEVEVRGGRPVQATRTSTDGSFARGKSVVAALLGVSAGRFVIAPDATPCRDAFDESLDALLGPPIKKARRLTQVITRDFDRIDHVEVDLDSMHGYLDATPDPVLEQIQRLAAGEAPRTLLVGASQERGRLELVLLDLARRGAIAGMTRDGEILDLSQAEAPSPRPEALAEAPDAPAASEAEPEEPSQPPQFTLDLSPAVDAAPSTQASADWPLDPAVTPGLDVALHSRAFRDESGTVPGVGPVATLATGEGGAPVIVRASLPPGESAQPAPVEEQEQEQPEPALSEPVPEAAPVAEVSAEKPASHEPVPVDAPRVQRFEAKTLISEGPVVRPIKMPRAEVAPSTEADAKPDAPVSHDSVVTKRAEAETVDDAPGREDEAPAREDARDSDPNEPVLLPSTKRIAFPSAAARATSAEAATPEPSPFPAEDPPEAELNAEAPPAKKSKSAVLSMLRVVVVMGAAGAASFGVVTWVRGMATSEGTTETPAAASAPLAAPTLAPPTAAAKAPVAAANAKVESLPLPPGIPLSDGKGLLEVDIGGKDAIYVDGTFVGRGPMRRIPLDPGKHEVRLRTPGEESTHNVEVSAGTRTRLSIEGK